MIARAKRTLHDVLVGVLLAVPVTVLGVLLGSLL